MHISCFVLILPTSCTPPILVLYISHPGVEGTFSLLHDHPIQISNHTIPTTPNMSPKVLIVCLGNFCRSPMSEAVLRHIAKERNIDLTVDSAGTDGYHAGKEPDIRSVL